MIDIIEAFRHQSELRPRNTAVSHRVDAATYEELLKLSQDIAYTIQIKVGYNPKVLIFLKASPFAYGSMLGTLMIGGTFCPIDIIGPYERNKEIIEAFKPDILLYDSTDKDLKIQVNNINSVSVDINNLIVNSGSYKSIQGESNEVAYVIFTSGSTGKPKGVSISRKGFSYFVHIAQNYFSIKPCELWGQYSNLGYDLAVMDVFMALCHGATLVTMASPIDRLMPGKTIKSQGINIWQSVPSVLNLMIESKSFQEDLKSLRIISFCGEPLLPSYLRTLFQAYPKILVFNTYGVTETTGFNTINILTIDNYEYSCKGHTVALGEEVPGWRILLKNGPTQQEGHIIVCGENLSLGYWNDKAKTKSKFRKVKIDGHYINAYFTGDWGKIMEQKLYFQGRIDRQIKIKGERIELDEIDYRIRELGFSYVGSVLKNEEIYSFIETGKSLDSNSIKEYLAKYLPFHALPKKIQQIDKLPRNQNGKIDYLKLRNFI